ncbi:MAG: YqgE/AlgH family protein [Paracoccaceae bacterium]|nr:YqgE/AlgH family protein [Paracoccaceae bacterium]
MTDLAGKLLIAMPGMGDQRFAHAVVLICAHSDKGAMGLIINKPAPDLSFAGLLEQLNIPRGPQGRDIAVHFGGPVERGRGFVLHTPDYRAPASGRSGAGKPGAGKTGAGRSDSGQPDSGQTGSGRPDPGPKFARRMAGDFSLGEATMQISGGFGLTATQDILGALAQGGGPKAALLALGYAGWGPGQLEAEVARNDWLIGAAPADLVFADEASVKWSGALRHMGVDPLGLSAATGRA